MTKRPNEKNERLKRRFLEYRKFARQLSEKTLDREIAALERFDVWSGRKDFSRFHIEQAMGFRFHLEQSKTKTGNPWANQQYVLSRQPCGNLSCGFLSKMDLPANIGKPRNLCAKLFA